MLYSTFSTQRFSSPISHSLFLAVRVTHRPVASVNLVRWLRTVLILAGVNTTVLSAHSTRKESATKAVGVGSKYKPSWRLLTSALAGTLNRFYNRSSFSKGDCMAFFTKSVLSLESLELTNGQPVSKSSDMQAQNFQMYNTVNGSVHTVHASYFPDCDEAGCRQAYNNFHTLIPTLRKSRNSFLSLFFHRF